MNRSQHAKSVIHQLGPQAQLFSQKPGVGRGVLNFVIAALIGIALGLAAVLAF